MSNKDIGKVIEKIIEENDDIRTQSEIANKLSKMGVEASQSKVSRAINDNENINKENGIYKVEKEAKKNRAREKLKKSLEIFESYVMENLSYLLVNCESGLENMLANLVVQAYPEKVCGTITGNNVVVIFTNTEKDNEVLKKMMKSKR